MVKRKRDDSSDSDLDEVTPGKQILPVANLPLDFDQEPLDGMQYLFLVRRDARRLPRITRVQNPYELPETKVAPASTPLSTNVLPCEEWRIAFQTHFSNLRKNLTQAAIHIDGNILDSARKVIPEKKDRDAWWKFLAGHPESTWSPRNRPGRKKISTPYRVQALAEVSHREDTMVSSGIRPEYKCSHLSIACCHDSPSNVSSSLEAIQTDQASLRVRPSMPSEDLVEEHNTTLSPPEVTPNHLREIDHRMSIHLLMYFTHWINVHLQNTSDPPTIISPSHGRWIFALLTKVEDQLSADEMNLLRNLARACLALVQKYEDERNAALGGISSATAMSNVSCWMIFAAVAGQWGQRDLWADAETTLAHNV